MFTAALTRHLLRRGVAVSAVKPACSGGREDARALYDTQAGRVPMDVINPWHYRKPVAPILAARAAGRPLEKHQMLAFLRASSQSCDLLLVEGAGGLLSPMGEGFDARDLIVALKARPWIVCPNRLGAVGQSRLVLESLSPAVRKRAQVVLVDPPGASRDASTRSNRALLAEWAGEDRLHRFPFLKTRDQSVRAEVFAGVESVLTADLRP